MKILEGERDRFRAVVPSSTPTFGTRRIPFDLGRSDLFLKEACSWLSFSLTCNANTFWVTKIRVRLSLTFPVNFCCKLGPGHRRKFLFDCFALLAHSQSTADVEGFPLPSLRARRLWWLSLLWFLIFLSLSEESEWNIATLFVTGQRDFECLFVAVVCFRRHVIF